MTEPVQLPTGRPRTLAEARQWMHQKLIARAHPLSLLDPVEAAPLIDQLKGLDGDSWVDVWGAAGDRTAELAKAAEARGDAQLASTLFMRAHGYYFFGRFPCPNHPRKLVCARRERETYLDAARFFRIGIERIEVPFNGRAEEGRVIPILVRRPPGVVRPPVVVMWGGVDAWKEQMTDASNALLAAGIATVAMDNVGTGESPIVGSIDGERQFLPVFDWIAAQKDLAGEKVGCLGRSFGGYWATKLAHLYPERIAGAVSWGGGAHHMFQKDWVEASRYPDSYLMELVETRSRMLGAKNDAEYIAFFQKLSLVDQGVLDRPCAPLLLVNGKFDKQCPVEDIFLLLDHGSPKSVRLFPGGHMGHTPRTVPTIVEWLKGRVQAQ